MQPRVLRSGVLAIDDTYNANPQSMRSALETLARLEQKGRRLAVLGRMGELGEQADEAHLELGRLQGLAQPGFDDKTPIAEFTHGGVTVLPVSAVAALAASSFSSVAYRAR